jgi:hypothetical protein
MSRIKQTGPAASSTYGPPADTGADDTPTISRDNYDMGSASRDGLGVGKTGGYSGLTYRDSDDNFKVSAGVGKRGSVGVGAKIGFKKGGKVSSASKRADGIARKGKTKGRMV